jgi:hypothetical protein
MIITQTVLGLVLLSQAAAAWAIPFLALQDLTTARRAEV